MSDVITRRWTRSAADEYAVSQGCYFDEKAGNFAVEFFRRFLCHSKGKWGGQPFELSEWQRDDVVMPIWGWKNPGGLRRIRKAYVEIPKKNGKSTLASGIGLLQLIADGEAGAEVYSAATAQEQASIVHGEAINMVDASPELSSILEINRSTKVIAFKATKSIYKALSSEAGSKEGLNASTIIADELHVWRGRTFWDTLKYAFAARSQPLQFVITTAGEDMLSVCYEQRSYGQQVMSGDVKDTRFYAYIRTLDAGDDWTKEEHWFKANPALGNTLSVDDFRADFQEALKTPLTQSQFRRYRLNEWATGTSPWIPKEKWAACKREFTEEDLLGLPCFAGLDLSQSNDMSSLVLVFAGEDKYYVLPYFWLPENTIQDRSNEEYLRGWARDEVLTSTAGDVTDYRVLRDKIAELHEKFDIRGLYYDPYNATLLRADLDDEYGIPCFPFQQSIKQFAWPSGEWERMIYDQQLVHNSHPILNWQVGHVQVKQDVNANKRPVKPVKGDTRKIDGVVAMIMGLSAAMEHETGPSVYETDGVAML